jgi:hypothetical protein
MSTQIEQLKAELRQFDELSKTITPGEWYASYTNRSVYTRHNRSQQVAYTGEDNTDATFIARSRNISPAMAECLLTTISKLEFYNDNGCPGMALLEEILTIWDASK